VPFRDKEKDRQWWAARRKAVRDIINAAKSRPCADCGISYPFYVMTFDHVRGEKKFTIGSGTRVITRLQAAAFYPILVFLGDAGEPATEMTLITDAAWQNGVREMASIDKEIAAFERVRGDLEVQSMGKWVLFHDGKLVSLYDEFEAAAEDAVKRFGSGPYLIRQVGAPPVTIPASVMYGGIDADNDELRVRRWAGWQGE